MGKQITVVIIALLGTVGLYTWKAALASDKSGSAMTFLPVDGGMADGTTITRNTPAPPEASVGTRVYRDNAFHFSINYPAGLPVQTYDEAGGAFTATFQDPTTHEGFEVYVTPYRGTQITQSEFNLDEPSGVMQNATSTLVDGVRATAFYGSNSAIGDTYELWFIRGGFLYEVTTYKQLDSWLLQIMKTWKFI